MKEDERKPNPWEAVDPKPPVIRSGHLENRVRNTTLTAFQAVVNREQPIV